MIVVADSVRFLVGWVWIYAQERLLGFALGSVSMGGFVLHQRRAIYRSLAEADGSPYSYQVGIWLLPPNLANVCFLNYCGGSWLTFPFNHDRLLVTIGNL